MKLVVGLGNPGLRYETTRHNFGFLALDRLADRWKLPDFSEKQSALQVMGTVPGTGEKVALLKPITFMNLSGKAVAPIFNFFQCAPTDLIVVHDDLDLSPLSIRIKLGGGTGGHNGLKSLDACLGAEAAGYYRVRLGIGKPMGRVSGEDHVLTSFNDEEWGKMESVLDDACEAIEMILKGDAQTAMNKFHTKKE